MQRNQKPQKETKNQQNSLGELKPQEIELILLIRTKYRFGSIEIVTRDGLPVDILRTVERTRMGSGSSHELSTT